MFKYNTAISGVDLTSYVQSNGFSWIEIIHYVKSYQKQIYQYSSVGDSLQVRFIQDELFCSKQAVFLAMRYTLSKKKHYQFKSQKSANDFSFVDNLSVHIDYLEQFATEEKKILLNLVIQELLLIVLRPEWEARIESNSYGFSPGLAINQAVIKVYSILSENKVYSDSTVLIGKTNNWFRKMDSSLILKKINCSSYVKNHLLSIFNESLFLSSSILINRRFQFIDIVGFPYNSITLLLANVIFYGLEMSILWKKASFSQTCLSNITTVICSNHFIVIFPFNNIQCISSIITCIRSFFKSIGFELQNSSLKALSIHTGFDFLGFNFRRYANNQQGNNQETRLIMKPTSSNIKKHLLSMRYCMYHKDRLNRWRANAQMTQYDVVNRLNPLIKEFSYYYYDLVPHSILRLLDRTLNEIIYRYAIKKYKSNRSRKWDDNWTIIINGKKMIGYKDKNDYKLLHLHNQP